MVGRILLFFLFLMVAGPAPGLDVVAGPGRSHCQEITLNSALNIYKDPSLFLYTLGTFQRDPELGFENLMEETPLITTKRRSVKLMILGEPTPFKNFGYISMLYGTVEPRLVAPTERLRRQQWLKSPPKILPVKLCGEDAYQDTLGFVLVSDLRQAQNSSETGRGLPPSIEPNPIPSLP